MTLRSTEAVAVIIRGPPDAPPTKRTPFFPIKMNGDMLDSGRLPGSGKLRSDG